MILGENGIKMGKRFPEFVVNPSDVVRDYGADTLRLYEMFMGPLEVSKPWSNQGVEGARRFLNRVWNFFTETGNLSSGDDGELTQLYHQTVKKVTSDFEKLAFNTAISQMMIFVNAVYKKGSCPLEFAKGLIKMLSCICPHIGEEIWEIIAATGKSIAYEAWPEYNEDLAREDEVEIAIQINGKVKSTIKVGLTEEQDSVKARVWEDANIKRITEGKTVVKEIYVKGKIYTIVIK